MAQLRLWINAFIPKDVPGYTQLIKAGENAGKTAVPLPGIARMAPGNMTKDWAAGYLTDQRSFSNNPDYKMASCRMQSWAIVDLETMKLVKKSTETSGTTEVNITNGNTTGRGNARLTACHVWQSSSKPNEAVIAINAGASDPLVSMAANIRYNGEFTISIDPITKATAVAFNGKIDAFPAFECYASLNGKTNVLFCKSPPRGNTVVSLAGTGIKFRPAAVGATIFS